MFVLASDLEDGPHLVMGEEFLMHQVLKFWQGLLSADRCHGQRTCSNRKSTVSVMLFTGVEEAQRFLVQKIGKNASTNQLGKLVEPRSGQSAEICAAALESSCQKHRLLCPVSCRSLAKKSDMSKVTPRAVDNWKPANSRLDPGDTRVPCV
jgi:hypothetical protein